LIRAKRTLLGLIILLPLVAVYPLGRAVPGTVVAVDPTENMVKVGETFSININITSVSGLVGFDFLLSYDESILNLTDIKEGPFLKSIGSTFLINLTTIGQVWLADLLYRSQGWTGTSANGSGVLATATFKAIAVGESSLNLFSNDPYNPNEIKLAADPQNPEVVPIPNVAIDGHVVVSSDPDPDPIAHALPSKTVVGQGYNLPINVTTTNGGNLPETLTVTSYANVTEIGTQTLALSDGSSSTVIFVWNTTGFAYGNYTIGAHATPASMQTNTADTTLAGAWAIVTIPGDLNGDFKVGLQDLVLLEQAYGSRPGDSNWNPNADLDGNGIVNLSDLVILTLHYGQHYP
jgi:hypothetical protein